MSSDVAIRIEGLGKAYRITHQEQQITIAEQALQRLRHPLRRAPVEEFWALSGVDLEIRRGEVLGLIGRNGAGKSTLLKVLSRITPPTNGRVDVYGRVGSLLEVGTGFHPELTGRENVYLNGSILGMRKREIDRQFDAIVDFAGVEHFLDTPVKRYSSGMYVRLAFAVAAHLETEILLIDEVLAVGDQEFQDRCIGKMRDVTTAGRTVVLVSHNLAIVQRLAERCVLLDRGEIVATGSADDVLDRYRGLAHKSNVWTARITPKAAGALRAAELSRVELVGDRDLRCGDPIVLDVEALVSLAHSTQLAIGVTLRSLGAPVGATSSMIRLPTRGPQRCIARVTLPSAHLAPGQYTLSVSVGAVGDGHPHAADDAAYDILTFDLAADNRNSWLLRNWHSSYGSLFIESEASLQEPTKAGEG